MKTLKQFVRENRIRIVNEWVDSNPNMEYDPRYRMTHYKCCLKRGNKQMTLHFSMGMAHTSEPTPLDVLSCLQSDASGADQDFESWASDLGYDEDSRKAERIHKTVKKQTEKLKKFLGNTLFNELLYEIEPY